MNCFNLYSVKNVTLMFDNFRFLKQIESNIIVVSLLQLVIHIMFFRKLHCLQEMLFLKIPFMIIKMQKNKQNFFVPMV